MARNVIVIATGIADPKWPLPPLEVRADGTLSSGTPPMLLGAFDEAALEVALRLRDAADDIRVSVVLFDPSSSDALARTVAAHRPDALVRIDAGPLPGWDAVAVAAFAADVVRTLAQPHLVLIGREFGDLDDGAVPPCIAEQLGWRFAALVQDVAFDGERMQLMRERGMSREWTRLAPPVVASITNDRKNRLRHPLFKNVAAAKRADVRMAQLDAAPPARALALAAADPASKPARAACRLIEGGIDNQASVLAKCLLDASEAS